MRLSDRSGLPDSKVVRKRSLGASFLLSSFIMLACIVPTESSAATGDSGYCDTSIEQASRDVREDYITGQVGLADQNYSRRPSNFANLSCLERLLNTGMDIFFSPPGMTELLSMIEQMVCEQASAIYNLATDQINTQLNDIGDGQVRVNVGQKSAAGEVGTNLTQVIGHDPVSRPGQRVTLPKSLGEMLDD